MGKIIINIYNTVSMLIPNNIAIYTGENFAYTIPVSMLVNMMDLLGPHTHTPTYIQVIQ